MVCSWSVPTIVTRATSLSYRSANLRQHRSRDKIGLTRRATRLFGNGDAVVSLTCAWSDGTLNGNAAIAALRATCDLVVAPGPCCFRFFFIGLAPRESC